MNTDAIRIILLFYGLFLIGCGISAVIFIGLKAKTALASGGISGCISLLIAYLVSTQNNRAQVAGLLLSFGLFMVFAWRSTKTFIKLTELIPEKHEDISSKSIAFLIISLMAVISVFVFVLQLIYF